MGHECAVVAPSLIPRKPGDRIKTDRRDAINLAKLHRAGELTPVWVPDQAHEAIRDLVRARQAAVRTLRQARQQLSGFLLRHGQHYHRPAWTLLHRRWLASLKFDQAVHHIVLEDCIAAIEAATARRDRLPASSWRISVWCRLSTRAGAHAARAALPKLVTARPGGC
jgi:transposase